ncbi:MAG TPA: helix-turn-helix domain-containing protein [Gaiellaceae bacterium]
MFQIGESLREARHRRGLTAPDVQKGIRIRERYLTALEEERWDMLPGEVYTKGFLRTYAEFLGLNGQLYIDEYNSRIHGRDEEPVVPKTLMPGRRRRARAQRRPPHLSSS